MAYKAFSVTVVTSPARQIDVNAETDDAPGGDASDAARRDFSALRYGQGIEFDVGANDIYVGGDNTVTTSTGRKYAAGTHVEVELSGGDHLWAVTATGSSVVNGSQVGV